MKHVMAMFGRTVLVTALTVGTVGVASALPLNDSLVDMDFTSTGQITVSLYGPLAGAVSFARDTNRPARSARLD